MNATRTITGKTSKGQTIEIKIERTISVQDKINYSDGWNVNMGKETIDLTEITVKVDGKLQTKSLQVPQALDPKFDKSAAKMIAAGAYARLGDIYINETRYNEIIAAIAQMTAELTTSEYAETKATEIAREQVANLALETEAAEYAQEIKNGLCPKCGTYCYGDCEA